jgi:hypothetical protein
MIAEMIENLETTRKEIIFIKKASHFGELFCFLIGKKNIKMV